MNKTLSLFSGNWEQNCMCVHTCGVTVCNWHTWVGKQSAPPSVRTKTRCPFTSGSLLASLALWRLLEKPNLAWCYHDVWALRAVSFPPKPKKDYSSDISIAWVSCVWAHRKWFPSNRGLWKPLSAQCFSLLCVFSLACCLSAKGSDCTCSELGLVTKLTQFSFTKSEGPVPLSVKLLHEVWGLFCSWLDENYLGS